MDYALELFRVAAKEFLFLSAFRQKIRKGIRVDIEDVFVDLEDIFREQARTARADPKLEGWYERARFPLVWLADEIIINSGWEHSQTWVHRSFQLKYFGNNVGGDEFFTMAQSLRPEDTPLASIIFAGLALGFKGRFRDWPDKLAEIRKNVYRLLAEYVSQAENKITPEAYNVQKTGIKRIAPAITLARVGIVSVTLLLVYWISTALLWRGLITELKEHARAMGIPV